MPRRSHVGDELDSTFAILARIAYKQFPYQERYSESLNIRCDQSPVCPYV
jgi:hypothetical protein